MADGAQSPVLYGYEHRPTADFKVENDLTEEIQFEGRTFVDLRSGALKFWHGVQAIFVDIKFIFEMIIECIKDLFRPASEKNVYIDVANDPPVIESDSRQVFVIPGLGDPGIWGHLLKGRFAAEDNIEVQVIKNQKNGNQPINESFQPILTWIQQYCTSHPNTPIFLAGVSLGGRLAHKIELALRFSHPHTTVTVYAMAPAFASQFATDMKEHVPCLADATVDPDLLRRFATDSNDTRALIQAENVDNNFTRTIIDVQASNDDLIDNSNAFPVLDNTEHLTHIKKVAYGSSHLGVIEKCMADIAATANRVFNPEPVI